MRRTTPAQASHTVLEHRHKGVPAPSTTDAREQVSAAATRARAEIESLVIAEGEQVQSLIDTAVKAAEERLRGATERRIDAEIKCAEEAAAKLRRDLKRMVKAEVAKARKTPPPESSGGHNVPIRARA